MITNAEQNRKTFFVSDLQIGMVYQDFLESRKRHFKRAMGPLDLTYDLRVALRSFIFAFGLTKAREMAREAYQVSKKPESLETKPELYFAKAWPTREAKVSKVVKFEPKKKRRKKRKVKLAGARIPTKTLEELHDGT